MKLPNDPRLPMLGGPNYDRALYSRLYELFRDISTAFNQGEDVLSAMMANAKWQCRAIREPFCIWDEEAGADIPPTTGDIVFIKLTASDAFNDGKLTGQSVSGIAPTISATAVIDVQGSPINGQTIHLINTERRIIRAGVSGALQDGQNLAHSHGATSASAGAHTHPYLINVQHSDGTVTGDLSLTSGVQVGGRRRYQDVTESAGAHAHAITVNNAGGDEARMRNIGATFYMRVK